MVLVVHSLWVQQCCSKVNLQITAFAQFKQALLKRNLMCFACVSR